MIRLIASDLDGTLLAPGGQLNARTIAAIAAAGAAGIEVIAATGRSFRTAAHRLRPAADISTMVCSNGALVYDLHREAVTSIRPMSNELFRMLVLHLRARIPELRFGWETVHGFGFEDDFGSLPGDGADPEVLGGPQHMDDVDEPLKAFVAHPEVERVELQRMVASHLPGSFNGTTSGAPFIEVTAAGVDKAQTMSKVAADRGVEAHEVLAMGDQMNDEALLRWAGTSVAMGNARPEIREIADLVAAPCAEDGAAEIIEAVVKGTLSPQP